MVTKRKKTTRKTKRKTTRKTTRKATRKTTRKATKKASPQSSKKALEAKIAQLEQKLGKLSSTLETKPAPPPQQAPPKPAPPPQQAPPPKVDVPKPADTTPPAPVSIFEALETAINNYPMTDIHYYAAKTPGYGPSPNRYYARRVALRGKAITEDWNLAKAKVTGYTAPSNQYFATRASMSGHPADKYFTNGFGFTVEGVAAQTQKAPPPKDEALPKTTTGSYGGGKKSKAEELADYEKDYLVRLEQAQADAQKEAAEAAEAEAKASSKGSMPKGWTG